MFQFVKQSVSDEFLSFKIDEKEFCIDLTESKEIIPLPHISMVPNVPDFVEGVINLRGNILHVVNLRKWLSMAWKMVDLNSRVVILDINGITFGIIVEKISKIIKLNQVKRWDVPEVMKREKKIAYLKSVISLDDDLILEIDPHLIQDEIKDKI